MFIWVIVIILVITAIWYLTRTKKQTLTDSTDLPVHDKIAQEDAHIDRPLVYNGSELEFSTEVLHAVLTKHFQYYNRLLDVDREKFISRLRKFIDNKIFIIHARKGYREMPILISASAIQLTFGLRKYLLSHFNIIQVFPEAFVGLEPFRILIGNVTGNTINIAWKQFLEGYKNKYDLQNVGLHEMAHALYYQNFETELYVDRNFKDAFQEFWAESIEIYFKCPDRLQLHYPDLYKALCDILHQDPLNYPNHLFQAGGE